MKIVLEKGLVRVEGFSGRRAGRRPTAEQIMDALLLWAFDTNAIDGVAAHFLLPETFVLARAKRVRMKPQKVRRVAEEMAVRMKDVGVAAIGGRLECELDPFDVEKFARPGPASVLRYHALAT